MDNEEQLERFADAVEQKNEEARAASEAPAAEGDSKIQGDEPDLTAASRTQDVLSPRQKGTAHKKMTADKWNQ